MLSFQHKDYILQTININYINYINCALGYDEVYTEHLISFSKKVKLLHS